MEEFICASFTAEEPSHSPAGASLWHEAKKKGMARAVKERTGSTAVTVPKLGSDSPLTLLG